VEQAETMSQVPIWFERKFEFSFPVELLPNLCARLRGTPARLEEALRGRSHEILIGKAQEKWSAQEHAGARHRSEKRRVSFFVVKILAYILR